MTVGLGVDIKEVYDELGSAFNIISRNPVVTGEKIIYELNAQATKPFIREHFLEATLPYDTVVTTDDVIKIIETDINYLVMAKTAELFEDSIVEWNLVLYKCNLPLTTHIVRPIEIRDPITYDMISGWQIIADDPVYGLTSDRVFGSDIEIGDVGQSQIWRIDLYLPKFYGLKPLDRLILSPTEYYKVETVQAYNYPGVVVAILVEDTRPETTFIGDEVYSDV